jgi:2-hydroxychromene-2-carboxylate isomerase
MARTLPFWFDVQCPFAYLASTQVRGLAAAAGVELVYEPMLLGGVYNALSDGGPYKATPPAQKQRWAATDALRWADYWGVPLTFPQGHPVRSVLAMRAILASGDIPRATHALFDAAWARGERIDDRAVLRTALTQAGFDDIDAILERAESEPVKTQLHEQTARAVASGIFGAPSFFVDGELFWGQDRLDFVARALDLQAFPVTPMRSDGPRPSEVEFWFDYASPYAYLGVSQIERIASAAGARVVFRPFLLGGLFRTIGTPDVPMMAFSEAKRRYMGNELLRWAKHWNVPFRFTSRFPMRTITPLRVTMGVLREEPHAQASRFIHGVYRALWVEDRDISQPEVLEAVCREQGIDPSHVGRADDPRNKQALLDSGQRAIELGLCGAPTAVVSGRLYWGQDRLQMVEAALRGWHPPV